MSSTVFLNGGFVSAQEAKISVWDGGWLHGAGLFETMRAYDGNILALDAHIDRLMNSAEKLLFPFERSDLPLTSEFAELLSKNELSNARIRLTATAGPTLETGSAEEEPAGDRPKLTICATAQKMTPYPPELYKSGMTVALCPHKVSPSDPLAGHKCTAYMQRLLGLRSAHAIQCSEALWFTTSNQLAEGCVSNVFLVKGGTLFTPTLETPVLPGIVRAAVLNIAAEQELGVEEKALTIDNLLDADEVFLTNSIMEIMPVGRIEKKEIGSGKPGAVTQGLAEQYRLRVKKECFGDG